MKTSSICHPQSSRFIQLHEWQKRFCQDDHCAALLLSFFSSWHDWKIQNDYYYQRFNDIAEAHGDSRPHNENAYLFFTMNDLVNALMGLFGKKSISDGLTLLVSLGVITIHKNPNPRYCFDKTKYFKFYSEVCNNWIHENYLLNKHDETDTQVVDNFDNAIMEDRSRKNARPSRQNGRPSDKNGQAITDTTNNTTNKHQSINARDIFLDNSENPILKNEMLKMIQPVMDALIEKGMSTRKFYPDTLQTIHRLMQMGVTIQVFMDAYDIANRSTQRGFGVNYLATIAEDLLTKFKKHNPVHGKSPPIQHKDNFSETVYESDTKNALKWVKGKEECKQA